MESAPAPANRWGRSPAAEPRLARRSRLRAVPGSASDPLRSYYIAPGSDSDRGNSVKISGNAPQPAPTYHEFGQFSSFLFLFAADGPPPGVPGRAGGRPRRLRLLPAAGVRA